MARTAGNASAERIVKNLPFHVQEGGNSYDVERLGATLSWEVRLSDHEKRKLPIEATVGGDRHGTSFLARIADFNSVKLPRSPLIEARYLQSATEHRLVRSPGFSEAEPKSFEDGIGRVLSPAFEQKCLSCHGHPDPNGLKEYGVHCETCHGAGQAHLLAVGKGNPRAGILNPGRLSNAESVEVCGRCHSGFSAISDPLPDDLLISSQATALRNTECYIQSNAGLSCTTCHDPHQNAKENEARYVNACLGCHAAQKERHASICPVNAQTGCIGCHMPTRQRGPFHMVDHWIRVVDEPKAESTLDPKLQSNLQPVRVFLRVLSVKDADSAQSLREQILKRASFTDLATKYSNDPSAPSGGYLGAVNTSDLDPAIRSAVTALRPGEMTTVLARNGDFEIFGRMPRDFRWRAGEIAEQASALRAQGKLQDASARYVEALRNYPHLLRALIFLGITQGQLGNGAQAYGILDLARRLYPQDAAAQYNLGIALGAMGRPDEEMEAYGRAIGLEPDLLPAYLNLGAALFSSGRVEEAITQYRKGLDLNPLSAQLYWSLGTALGQAGRSKEADEAMRLAAAINPEFAKQQTRSETSR